MTTPRFIMTRALLLDLDNTLIDRDAAFLAWLGSQASRARELDVQALVALDRGGHGRRGLLYTALGLALGLSAARARETFERELPEFVKLKDDAALLLERFDGAKVIVTNGSPALQRAKIRAAGLDARVDAAIVSSELGEDKPHPSVFREALSRAGVQPHEARMVGDHPVCDIYGALAVGVSARMLRTRWFDVPVGVSAIERLTEAMS